MNIEERIDKRISEIEMEMYQTLVLAEGDMQDASEDIASVNDTFQKYQMFTARLGVLDKHRRELADRSRDIRALLNVKSILKEKENNGEP